jgi:hypothetical protein
VSLEEVLLVTALFKDNFHIDDKPVLGLLYRVVVGDDVDVSETRVSSIFRLEACSSASFCVCVCGYVVLRHRWREEVRETWVRLHPFFTFLPYQIKTHI